MGSATKTFYVTQTYLGSCPIYLSNNHAFRLFHTISTPVILASLLPFLLRPHDYYHNFDYIHRPPWHTSKASQTILHHIQTILGLHPKIIFLCFLTLDKSISFITLRPYYHGNRLGPLILNRWTSNQIRTGSDIIGFLVSLKSNYKASKFMGKVNQITKLKCYIFFHR